MRSCFAPVPKQGRLIRGSPDSQGQSDSLLQLPRTIEHLARKNACKGIRNLEIDTEKNWRLTPSAVSFNSARHQLHPFLVSCDLNKARVVVCAVIWALVGATKRIGNPPPKKCQRFVGVLANNIPPKGPGTFRRVPLVEALARMAKERPCILKAVCNANPTSGQQTTPMFHLTRIYNKPVLSLCTIHQLYTYVFNLHSLNRN